MIKSINQCFHSVRTENVGTMLQPKLRATLGPVWLWYCFLWRWLWPYIRSHIDKEKLYHNFRGFPILHQKYKDLRRQRCYREHSSQLHSVPKSFHETLKVASENQNRRLLYLFFFLFFPKRNVQLCKKTSRKTPSHCAIQDNCLHVPGNVINLTLLVLNTHGIKLLPRL